MQLKNAEEELFLVTCGALLHDIGKFVQRAGITERMRHPVLGETYLKSKFQNIKKLDLLPLFVKYHHAEDLNEFRGDKRFLNLLRIVSEADKISASEREEYEIEYGAPLKSIFSSIKLGNKNIGDNLYYTPSAIDLKQVKFPEKLEIARRGFSEHYKKIFKEFDDIFSKLVMFFGIEKLLMLLEKYTSYIPAVMSVENDISLFDHLKSTAAIASCLYLYHQPELDESPEIENKKIKKYIFVGGDFSGIQNFIYNVTYKGALKHLRARSTFLEFMTYDVAIEIIERMNLTIANVIYIGGGNFYLLLPNNEKSLNVVDTVNAEVNKWLLENFDGEIYMAIAYVKVDGNSIMKMEYEKGSIWDEINTKLRKKKHKKFYEAFPEKWWLLSPFKGVCGVCGKREEDSKLRRETLEDGLELKICRYCESLRKIGKDLIDAEFFVRSKEAPSFNFERIELPFSNIYIVKNKEDLYRFSQNSIIFVKNSYDPIVELPHKQITFLIADYSVKDEIGKNVKSLDKIAEKSIGAKRVDNQIIGGKVAMLKMDVDNLGKIFSEGLENPSISRASTLSRSLNIFFKGYLNTIIEKRIEALDTPKISSKPQREVVVIYSGGDDVMIVGTWNDVFELAFEIHEVFRKYVGLNPSITISGGYGIFDEKTPIVRMAKIVSERLEIAKDEGRDRIYLMDRETGEKYKNLRSYKWDEFKRFWKEYSAKLLQTREFPRTLIYRLLDARRKYLEDEKSVNWFIYPMYLLSRRSGEEKAIFSRLFVLDPEKAPQEIFFIDVPLKLVDLVLRGGDET
jgi:CRISPR-associated protein Csm1